MKIGSQNGLRSLGNHLGQFVKPVKGLLRQGARNEQADSEGETVLTQGLVGTRCIPPTLSQEEASMTKLSAAQVAILRRMAKGEEIALMTKGVRHDTLFNLALRGLIEDVKPDWAGGIYAITPAGRAYLEENDVDS